MEKYRVTYAMRAIRTAVATWLAAQVANNIWWTPVIVALGKALRDKFGGAVEKWLPL